MEQNLLNEDALLLELMDRHWRKIGPSQIRDTASYWYGAFTENGNGKPFEGLTSSDTMLHLTVPLYAHPESPYYRNTDMLGTIRLQIRFLLRAQLPSGCISLHNCNIDSPPDTGFSVHFAALCVHILDRMNDGEAAELAQELRLYLQRTIPGLLAGGIHTPNHRWVLCGALALLYELFGDERLRARADSFLAEGLDINPDGEWTERSNAIYNAVCAIFLYQTARVFGYAHLYEPIARNLRMMQYMLHPRSIIATEYSSRQDRGEIMKLNAGYYVAFSLMASQNADPLFHSFAREALLSLHTGGEALLYRMFLRKEMSAELPLQPLPDRYEVFLNRERTAPVTGTIPYRRTAFHAGSPLIRFRRGELSVTVMAGQPEFLYLQYGQARLLGVRLALGWFGVAGTPFAAIKQTGEHEYELSMELEGSYRDALDENAIGRTDPLHFAESIPLRAKTNVAVLPVRVGIRLDDTGVDLHYRVDAGAPPLFVQAVYAFAPEGSMENARGGAENGAECDAENGAENGAGLVPINAHASWLKSGQAIYRCGEDWIAVDGGAFQHGFECLRNDRLDPGVLSAVANYLTPVESTVRIRCGKSVKEKAAMAKATKEDKPC
ncbi:hypothetical protein [Cohnella fermenti]|uniref:Heparinase n=1 Tax=Cohnella fermenti TaxID=2565925 RepID=A0A4S4BJM8_9BACL|nr:hypothetical protein [Cohnella fermenti]THF74302.1 hypothetical protein E6C55_25725 [Cohnella fermenti]